MASEDGSSAEHATCSTAEAGLQTRHAGCRTRLLASAFGGRSSLRFEREKDLASLTVASVPSLIADARKDDVAANERAAEALHHLANTEDWSGCRCRGRRH